MSDMIILDGMPPYDETEPHAYRPSCRCDACTEMRVVFERCEFERITGHSHRTIVKLVP